MKKLILLFSLFTLLLCNCADDTYKQALVGTWEVTQYKADLPAVPPAVLKSAEESTLTNSFSFNTDQTFIKKSKAVPNGNKGKWAYNKDSKILELNYQVKNKNSKVIYIVEELSKTETKWLLDMKGTGTVRLTLKNTTM